MMYGLETAAMTKKQERQLEVAEMRMNEIMNEHIRTTLMVDMFKQKVRWYGRVKHRMLYSNHYVGRKVLEMQLPGKRKRGRQKRRYLNVMKENMQEVAAREDEGV